MVAGNFCADMAATMALKSLPGEIRKLADAMAAHVKSEEHNFLLQFFAASNKRRLQAAKDKGVVGTRTTSWQQPRCPTQNANGLFPSAAIAMGSEALECMKNFSPGDYVQLLVVECDDATFGQCLQGANIAKATKLWLESLMWLPNLD